MHFSRTAAIYLLLLVTTIGFVSAIDSNRITYSNGIDPPIEVIDDSGLDNNPNPLEIEVNFHLDDPNGDWEADGVIFAKAEYPGGASLIVTDTTIVNITGNQVLGAIIEVNHYFDPIVDVTQQYVAHADGAFDKIGGGILGNFIFDVTASLNGAVIVDNFPFAGGLGPSPETFGDTSLPVNLHTVNRQTELFIIYIDELDNFIELYDSVTILPTTAVPVMHRGFLVALAAGLMGLMVVVICRRYVLRLNRS